MRRRMFSKVSISAALLGVTALAAVAVAAVAATTTPNLVKALEAQRKLAAERPQDASVQNDLGNLLLLSRQSADAEAAYRRAIELDPQKVSALYNLGVLLQQRGELREALRLFEQAVEVEPGHAWAHYQIGSLYETWKRESRAIEAYSRAFALDPQLSFPDVNPQIVDNKLVTESMLRAYREGYDVSQEPKFYEDRVRIANLLEPPPVLPKPDAAADTAAEQQAARPTDPRQTAGGSTVLRQGDLDPASSVGQATPQGGGYGRQPSRGGYTSPGGYAGPGYGVPGARTLRDFSRPQPQVDPEGRQQVITPPPGGVYYRPDVPSTGRLELRLVPGAPKDAHRTARG